MKTESPEPVETTTPVTRAYASDDFHETTPRMIHLKNILVPLDFSEMSLKSLQYAVPFARLFGAKITLLHVQNPPMCQADFPSAGPTGQDSHEVLERRLEEIRLANIPSAIPTDLMVRLNFVFDGILEVAREIHADLIITSTHGNTGLKHLLMGSTAENIVRRAPCPVFVVRELEHDFV